MKIAHGHFGRLHVTVSNSTSPHLFPTSLQHDFRHDIRLARLAAGLVMSGVLFTCFKFGEQDREVDGRRFTDLDEDEIEVYIEELRQIQHGH